MLLLGTPADMHGMIAPYSFPSSRKLKYPVLLKMMWSSNAMPTISPAALSWAVMLMSLDDGSKREIRLRCVVRPAREQELLLQRLGLTLPERLRPPAGTPNVVAT